MTASGWVRKTPWTASTPSSAVTTVNPARSSTVETMRRSVGLSSAISTVSMNSSLSSAQQTADRIDEFGLVELALEQISAGTCVQTGPLVGRVPPRGHDHDGHVLPAAGPAQRAGQRETVHAGHLDVGDHEVDRVLAQPGRTVHPVDGCQHVV